MCEAGTCPDCVADAYQDVLDKERAAVRYLVKCLRQCDNCESPALHGGGFGGEILYLRCDSCFMEIPEGAFWFELPVAKPLRKLLPLMKEW
jgi:hypothetical protein